MSSQANSNQFTIVGIFSINYLHQPNQLKSSSLCHPPSNVLWSSVWVGDAPKRDNLLLDIWLEQARLMDLGLPWCPDNRYLIAQTRNSVSADRQSTKLWSRMSTLMIVSRNSVLHKREVIRSGVDFVGAGWPLNAAESDSFAISTIKYWHCVEPSVYNT